MCEECKGKGYVELLVGKSPCRTCAVRSVRSDVDLAIKLKELCAIESVFGSPIAPGGSFAHDDGSPASRSSIRFELSDSDEAAEFVGAFGADLPSVAFLGSNDKVTQMTPGSLVQILRNSLPGLIEVDLVEIGGKPEISIAWCSPVVSSNGLKKFDRITLLDLAKGVTVAAAAEAFITEAQAAARQTANGMTSDPDEAEEIYCELVCRRHPRGLDPLEEVQRIRDSLSRSPEVALFDLRDGLLVPRVALLDPARANASAMRVEWRRGNIEHHVSDDVLVLGIANERLRGDDPSDS